MDTFELVGRLAVALAIGLVIGIERGWKQRGEAEGERAAGLRTLALSGLLGGIWGALALNAGRAGLDRVRPRVHLLHGGDRGLSLP